MSDAEKGSKADRGQVDPPIDLGVDTVQSPSHFLQYAGKPGATVPSELKFMVPDEMVEVELLRVLHESLVLKPYCRCIHCVEYE